MENFPLHVQQQPNGFPLTYTGENTGEITPD